MDQNSYEIFAGVKRIPHTRGDGPVQLDEALECGAYSPHAWGWTEKTDEHLSKIAVFPTRVGMDRPAAVLGGGPSRIPHTRGDGPQNENFEILDALYSPHAWGWTVRFEHDCK